MKRFRVLFNCSLLLAFCAAGALGQTVQSDFDRNFNLARLQTYAFYKQERGPNDPLASSPINDRRIHDALNSQLQANGFRETANPDFMIAYFVKTQKSVEIQDNRWGFLQRRGSIDVEQITEGSIIVVFVDSASKQEVWRGFASGEVRPKDLDKDVVKAVTKLVQKFKQNQAGKK